MKAYKILFITPLLGILAMPVLADHDHGYSKIDRRLDRQSERIEQGIDSGELTRKEAKVLWKQHRRITKAKRKFVDDGDLSRKERRTLKRKLEKASDKIYALKHNDRSRRNYTKHRTHHHDTDYSRYKKHREYSHHDGYVTRAHRVGNNDWSFILRQWDF